LVDPLPLPCPAIYVLPLPYPCLAIDVLPLTLANDDLPLPLVVAAVALTLAAGIEALAATTNELSCGIGPYDLFVGI
jgi:hypothetical protein